MSQYKNIIDANKTNWNLRVELHTQSSMYDVEGFLNGNSSLRHIELEYLENKLEGKNVLHLQCHFGLDSFSLERLGANVTGVDFSEDAINKALELKNKLNSEVKFVLSNVLELKKHLNDSFDFIFTSYGTIVWLPDLKIWGEVIDHFLKPGGEFFMIDFHPVMYMLDDNFEMLYYEYFRKKEPFHSISQQTYTDQELPVEIEEYFWNQSIAEIMRPFIKRNYHLLEFNEYNYSTYDCFPEMEEIEDQKFVFKLHQHRIPYLYLMHLQKESLR